MTTQTAPSENQSVPRSPEGARYAIVASRWNAGVVDTLVDGARRVLAAAGADGEQVRIVRVPGAWEIPAAVARLAATGEFAALIALGCVVRGDTRHYEHVADGCAHGLMEVSVRHALPVLNGVLAVELAADAEARAGGRLGNKGEEVARAAVTMAGIWETL